MEHEETKHSEARPDPINLSAYFDGEIADPGEVARFEAMIREDAGLREQLRALETLRTQLRRLPRAEAPPYVRKKVLYMMSARGRRAQAFRRGARYVAVAALILVVVASAFWTGRERGMGHDSLFSAMVADHAKYMPAARDTELFADDASDIETWLSARLDFTPAIPRWEWAELLSGRACHINDNTVALVRYRCGGKEMSLYIWPQDRPLQGEVRAWPTTPKIRTADQGYAVALWAGGELAYGLVAEGGAASLADRLGRPN